MLATVAQWLVLATLTGTLVGAGTSLFLYALFFVSAPTETAPLWLHMVLLPLGGLFNGLLLHWGYRANKTGLKDSTIAAVHQQAGRMPLATAWIKPVAALATLASGGSAGRTGPCSHIGGAVAAGIGKVLHLNGELRKRLVACGISAGFAGVFGTPIAGAVYGVEILTVGYLRHDFLFPATVAGFASFEISKLVDAPYIEYFTIGLPDNFSEILFIKTVIIGIICGLVAWLYVYLIELARRGFKRFRYRFNLWPPLMPLLGGVILAVLIIVIPTDYLGLSLPLMDHALAGDPMPYLGFLWKSILVAITLGSGFYGGVVTPQLVIGAMTGNAFSHLLGFSPALGGAIGLVAVVAAASDAPIAAILMGIELFDTSTGTFYASGAAIAAYLVIGHRSVYPDQLLAFTKSSWISAKPGLPLDKKTLYLSFGLRKWLSYLRKRRRGERR
ncbi:chloride channel protein [Salinisphaera sp.]|uniref:chloride channel protein n=1 Tax=Salinisphaera sp. TaxID=1914330 RepID=UPI002D78FB04|nr:chloride channel protein [Salinisphaera sp.]HET7314280.1 chloride channel protein [Salinisphaera sp.]